MLETVHDAVVRGFGLWWCFIPPPCASRVDEGIRVRVTGRRSARAASVLPYLLSLTSVVGGVEVRPPLGDLGRALLSRSVLILSGHPGVAPWLSHGD